MKNLYDCHCHLNLPQFDENRDEIIAQCKNELEFLVNIGFSENSSEASILLSYNYDFIYAAVGIHPTETKEYNKRLRDRIYEMGKEDKVVAIGEIGLDYYWMKDSEENQKKVFRSQIEIAEQLKKPIIIHDRDAHNDTISIISEYKGRVNGILHSFSGDMEMMKKALELDYYFSISGPVTFKNKKNNSYREVIKQIPLDRIIIETDSPYLAPHPLRGTINNPLNVKIIAEKIAELHNITLEEFLEISIKNAKTILKIL